MPATTPDAPRIGALQIVRISLDEARHSSALLDLLEHYARDPMGGGEGLRPAVRDTLVAALRGRHDYVGFLAFAGNDAVGLVNCFEGFSTFAAQPLLNVHDIVVRSDCRGHGVGRALLGAVEQHAREAGFCKLTLEVLSNNHAALATYTRCGFAPYVLDPAAGNALFLQKWLQE